MTQQDLPEKGSWAGLADAVARWREQHQACEVCSGCWGELGTLTVYVSIHSSAFGDSCGGAGRAAPIAVPYCPRCEGEPPAILRTCVHVGGLGR